jgi:hypothetical protein
LNILNGEYSVIKEDPILEFPADTIKITYFINKTLDLDKTQDIDTVIVDKNVKISSSTTGFSILGISSLQDITIDGKFIMVAVLIILGLLYVIINFNIYEKVKKLFFGEKKKITYIKVLINDALDYLNVGDDTNASLIYREIKLTYETSPESIRRQIFEESYNLCNKLDLSYFNQMLEQTEDLIASSSYNRAIDSYDKLEKTYNKIDDKYKKDLYAKLSAVYSKLEQLNNIGNKAKAG